MSPQTAHLLKKKEDPFQPMFMTGSWAVMFMEWCSQLQSGFSLIGFFLLLVFVENAILAYRPLITNE